MSLKKIKIVSQIVIILVAVLSVMSLFPHEANADYIPGAFVTTWKTDNPGTSESNQITIPTYSGETYNYNVDWGDSTTDSNVTGDITHTYANPGTYTVSISGTFPRININYYGDKQKILSVEQWGSTQWSSMAWAFYGASNLIINATDTPNLSSVTDMSGMFSLATSFNQNINNWDVSHVTNMYQLFYNATSFNQPLNSWNVSSVTNMGAMFVEASSFNQNINSWNVSNVTDMNSMFYHAISFNQPLNLWDLSNVVQTSNMFQSATSFNQDISSWNVSNVTTTKAMFAGATSFNQPLNSWDVSNVTDMSWMFDGASLFNQDISSWNVSKVINMSNMFDRATSFNQPLNSWNVGSVINMSGMFCLAASFNQPLNSWNVSNVVNMEIMFNGAYKFNKDINSWDVSNVTNMYAMFDAATAFNQPLNSWNVSHVTRMELMFGLATSFNQDISNWNISNVTNMITMFYGITLSTTNYDALLASWSTLTLQPNVTFDAGNSKYFNSEIQKQSIIDTYGWTITDGGKSSTNPYTFITTWKTDNPGTSNSNQITIPTTGTGYDYNIDWGDSTTDSNVTGNITHTYSNPGIYTVSISGTFPRIYFDFQGDRQKILSVEQWGSNTWSSMASAFRGATNLVINATDVPDLSLVTDTSMMFHAASLVNPNTTNWDVSHVVNMYAMFAATHSFNSNISNWDVSHVTNMSQMFEYNSSFNQDISSWDVSNVTDMSYMFNGATSFNQDISSWNVSNVINMDGMFYNAFSFNQPLNSWNVSNLRSTYVMFASATSFNQPLNNWNVSNIQSMYGMFSLATSFNQPLNSWNVSRVQNMEWMFLQASSFNQDISSWDVSNVTTMEDMFNSVTLSTTNYDTILSSWSALTLQPNVTFGAGNSKYYNSGTQRQSIIDNYGWTITDGGLGLNPSAFVTTWKTDNPGTSESNQITIPTYPGETYNYNVDWGDSTTDSNITGDITHTYANSGTYTVMITGTFPRIYFNNEYDKQKIISVEQWGTNVWNSMGWAFAGCFNLVVNSIDAPNLSNVTDMSYMFYGNLSFNSNINNWDVSNIELMGGVFREAASFNQPLNNWDVSNVTTMGQIFYLASSFNQPLNNWNVSKVISMDSMFGPAFNQDISSWNVSNVKYMYSMFSGATSFNQPLNNWDVSSVQYMNGMFDNATSFNQDISSWNVSNVTNMNYMFSNATSFNQPLNNWDVSNVVFMNGMFNNTPSFNQDISSWNVSNVTNMSYMFNDATSFNQPLNNWDVSRVAYMNSMFSNTSSFNQDISSWNVSNVTEMSYLFNGATSFNLNISNWNVSGVINMSYMFNGVTLSTSNYDAILSSWSALTLQPNVIFNAGNSKYYNSATQRQSIIDNYGWTITDGGLYIPPIIPTVITNQAGNFGPISATLYGTSTSISQENNSIRGFQYGLTDAYGTVVYTTGSFSLDSYSNGISSLTCNTTYHFRSYASNSAGTGYGDDMTFTTSECPPSPTISSAIPDSNKSITITWTGNSTYYTVENITNSETFGWTTSTSHQFTNLVCNANYSFRVKGMTPEGVQTAWTETYTVAFPCSIIEWSPTGTGTITSQEDFELGTLDSTLNSTVSPGDLSLKIVEAGSVNLVTKWGSPANNYTATVSKEISLPNPWSAWEEKELVPTEIMAAGSSVIGDKIYVTGAMDIDYNPTDMLYAYDTVSNTWETKTPMPTVRGTPLVVTIGTKLYVMGGRDFENWDGVATLEVYDSLTDTWETKASMTYPRIAPVGGVLNGKIYVVGGASTAGAEEPVAHLEVYDPDLDTWETIETTIPPEAIIKSSTSQFIDGKLYIVGGTIIDNTPFHNNLTIYDPETNTWDTTKAYLPTNRAGGASVLIDGKLYYIGGQSDDYFSVTDIYTYDTVSNTWTTYPGSLPNAIHRTSAQVVGNDLYLIGGRIDIPRDGGGTDWFPSAKTYKINKSNIGVISSPKKITQLSWTATIPEGTSIEMFYSLDGGVTYTSLGTTPGTYDLPIETTNTIKYKAELLSPANTSYPTLDSLTLFYTYNDSISEYQESPQSPNWYPILIDGEFYYPRGITADSLGNIYVADSSNNRIQKFSSNGEFILKWNTGDYSSPIGITTDSQDNVYVENSNRNNIQKYNSNGVYISSFGGAYGQREGEFNGLSGGIIIDENGNIYVADTNNNRIQKFNSNGEFISTFGWGVADGTDEFQVCISDCQTGLNGSGDGEFSNPMGITIDSIDNIYIVDRYNQRIQKFSSDGEFISKWGSYGSEDGQFTYPTGIITDNFNNIYVLDFWNYRIQKFSSDGEFISKWGSYGSEDGQFNFEWSSLGITTDSLDNIYVADTNNQRIQKFQVNTSISHEPSGVFTSSIINTTKQVDWTTITTDSTIPDETTITLQTRSGSGAIPDETWSAWEETTGDILSPDNQYIQVKVTLSTTNIDTPILHSITLNYIVPTEPITEYTLTYIAGLNGTIQGNSHQTINQGSNGTQVRAVANSGYHFVNWSDNLTTTTRTDLNIVNNISVTANFEKNISHNIGGSTPVIITTVPITTPLLNGKCKSGDLFDTTTGKSCSSISNNPITPNNPSTPSNPSTSERTLKQGMTGNDVKVLQVYLNTNGYIVSSTGPGSLGNETTYFGLKTKAAVILFQIANGLEGDGIVGKMTREKMK